MDILNADWKPEEREAIKNLAVQQGLSPMSVIRQALRLYQSTVNPVDLGPSGCMGDD